MAGLLFYMHDGPKTFRFELAGALSGSDAAKMDQAWRTASSTFDGKVLAVDITFVTEADEKGRDVLFRWWRAGAHLVANSEASRKLAESITGVPYAPGDAAVGPTFEPRFTASAFRAAAAIAIFTVALLFPAKAWAKSDEASAVLASAVLERYSASLADRGLDTATVTLEIEASVPKLQKQARIEAIRRWTDGKREYQFVTIEGDRLVRNEMIARYFAIDTEQAPLAAPITKSNYKFRFVTNKGSVSVFQITPRKKRKGMIAGEMWIDNETGPGDAPGGAPGEEPLGDAAQHRHLAGDGDPPRRHVRPRDSFEHRRAARGARGTDHSRENPRRGDGGHRKCRAIVWLPRSSCWGPGRRTRRS